ncbi:MAG: hypothetical protein V3V09_04015 [Arenicellales bacterium]
MRQFVPLDPESGVSENHWAVVFVPKRSRNRFPANCVETYDSHTDAIEQSDSPNRKFAAQVIGPSKSSEGQAIYYLVRWLQHQP